MIRGLMHWADDIEPALYLARRGCSHLPRQFATYKYRRDRTTGDITEKTIDHDDHCLDALAFLVGKLFGATTVLKFGGPLF